MKVGVLLPSRFEEPGEFLADARAMEAAGVDSIWIEDHPDGIDPWLAMAAIAAATGTVRLGLILVDQSPSPLREASGRGSTQRQLDTLQQLSRHRAMIGAANGSDVIGDSERWRRVDVPADRQAWADTLERAQPQADGVLVPIDPRLLDILRHPDEAIDRSDLQLAQG